MSTGWAIVAIIGAFVLGMIGGAVIMATAPSSKASSVSDPVIAPVEFTSEPEPPRRLDVAEIATPEGAGRAAPKPAPRQEYVITSVGEPEPEIDGPTRTEFAPRPQFEQVARTVLIEAASLAHGVRNALSEENRAKISYEVKRELIRLRKDRKIEVKEALREYRAKHRAPVDPETGEGA